jgi:hypothetical protein
MPTPSPATDNTAHTVLHGVWTGVTNTASQHPWLVVVLALLVLTALVRSVRVAIHSGPRDPVRRFTRTDKATLLARAGRRCEHHGWIGGRCASTEKLEADHVHPWSRGGSTHVGNGQILCHAHNRTKNASIPWDRSLRKLAVRRASYYPGEADRAVVRKIRRPANVSSSE